MDKLIKSKTIHDTNYIVDLWQHDKDYSVLIINDVLYKSVSIHFPTLVRAKSFYNYLSTARRVKEEVVEFR